MPYFFFDSYFLILVVPALILAFYAQFKVNSTYKRYASVLSRRGITGAQAAEMVLREHEIYDVQVVCIQGNLTDHYDPKRKTISLSQSVYSSTSVAAIGVAAHEAGHAAQYARGYAPIKLRSAIIPASQFGSMLGFPLAIMGIIFQFGILVTIGIILYGLAVFFQLVTLPVEYNASARAISTLDRSGILGDEELQDAKKVLNAAALTYVAALAASVAQLLRLILLSRNGRH